VSTVLSSMVSNILDSMEPSRLLRITLDNNVLESMTVDALVGRAAHISFLDSPVIAAQLVYSLYQYLK
jgi:hypothetical protein